MKLFWPQRLFLGKVDFKNGCKNEFENNNEKIAAELKIEFPTKSISKPFGLTSLIRQCEG